MKGLAAAFVAVVVVCAGQTPAPLHFDVASLRVADSRPPYTPINASGEIKGGPGTGDPTRMTFTWVSARMLLMKSFALPLEQIAGSDQVLGQDFRFNILANVPAGATKEQADEMLLNLLRDRLHLTYHREKRVFDMYALVVAKGGPKLKRAARATGPLRDEPAAGTMAMAASFDRDGFPVLPAGRRGFRGRTANGVTHLTFRMADLEMLASVLSGVLGRGSTVDKTGLTGGPYDFTLTFSHAGLPGALNESLAAARARAGEVDDGPSLFTALEKQLGLKLEKFKGEREVVVIDHLDKQPAEN